MCTHLPVFAAFTFVVVARAFPVDQLEISQQEFDDFNNVSRPVDYKEQLATQWILPKLRIFFNASAHAIEVQPSDVSLSAQIPDQVVDNSCDHTITAEHPKGTGSILNTSYLRFGISQLSWKEVEVFADAEVDAALDIDADVKVELGKHVFGHSCTHLGSKTIGVNVHSTGKNGLGVNFTASNATIERAAAAGGWELVFQFHADVVGVVLSWNVDDVTARNCKIEILGIDIGSYCGFLEREIRDGVNTLSSRVTRMAAPKIAEKLESIINTAIGSTVRIPIRFPLY